MKDIVEYILETKNILENQYIISDRMFIKALKSYGELSKEDLNNIFGEDDPLKLNDDIEIESIRVDRGHLYFSFINKDNREVEIEGSIEDYDDETIYRLYDYIIN